MGCSRSRRRITLVAPLIVALAGCTSAQEVQQSNEFVDSLNAAQQELLTVTTSLAGARDPAQFAKAIDRIMPAVERKMQAVEAAQASLPDDLKPLGATCVTAMKKILTDLGRVGAAAESEKVAKINKTAAQLQESGDDFGSKCVDQYNAAVGQN